MKIIIKKNDHAIIVLITLGNHIKKLQLKFQMNQIKINKAPASWFEKHSF